METPESFEPLVPGQPVLNYEAQTYLREAGKWAAFLGIIGFIFCAFLLIGAFSVGAIFTRVVAFIPSPEMAMLAGFGGVITVVFILIDLLYFFFSLYLYQFGSNVKKGLLFNEDNHITNGLGKLRSFFRLWGILTIISIVLNLFLLAGGIIAGMHAASLMQR